LLFSRAEGDDVRSDPARTERRSKWALPRSFQVRVPTANEGGNAFHTWAMTPDGQRFLIIVNSAEQLAARITVVLNWASGFENDERLGPRRRDQARRCFSAPMRRWGISSSSDSTTRGISGTRRCFRQLVFVAQPDARNSSNFA